MQTAEREYSSFEVKTAALALLECVQNESSLFDDVKVEYFKFRELETAFRKQCAVLQKDFLLQNRTQPSHFQKELRNAQRAYIFEQLQFLEKCLEGIELQIEEKYPGMLYQ